MEVTARSKKRQETTGDDWRLQEAMGDGTRLLEVTGHDRKWQEASAARWEGKKKFNVVQTRSKHGLVDFHSEVM